MADDGSNPTQDQDPKLDPHKPPPWLRRLMSTWLLITPFIAGILIFSILGALDLGICTPEEPDAQKTGHAWLVAPFDKASCGQHLFLLAATSGALGSSIHALTSFASYRGNEALRKSWFFWYVARAPVGAALAAVTYFVFRGGMMPGTESQAVINPYATAAICALAGMFSKQAVDKLREVFDALFSTKAAKERKHSITADQTIPPAHKNP